MVALTDIEQLLSSQPRKPPLHLWQPALSGDIDIRIDSRGDWYHEGTRMQRQALVNLFASILRREADGEYYLVTPVEKWRIRVDDAALIAVDMEVGEGGDAARRIVFRLNTDDVVELDSAHGLSVLTGENGEPRPYLTLDHGLSAKLNTAVFYRLVDIAEVRANEMGVHSNGQWFPIGTV